MKTRVKIILWTIPLLVIIFTLISMIVISSGVTVKWKLIGKPSESITKIIGVKYTNRKLYVLTASGNTYSLYFKVYPASVPIPGQWNKENDDNISTDPVKDYGGKSFTPPPPPFKVKQIYKFEIPATESSNETRYALSEDGNLWYWSFSYSAYQDLFYVMIIAIEILIYLLALFINFAIFLTKRIIRRVQS